MIHRLYTTGYDEPNPARRLELDLCRHVNRSSFHFVCVLAENLAAPFGFIGAWVPAHGRQTYAQVLRLAQNAEPTDLVVIANADIFISKWTLSQIDFALQDGEALALSRWDIGKGPITLFDKVASGDAWVFRGRPKVNGGEYPFGVPGCDNRFAHEIDASGYKVFNPALDCKAFHVHGSGIRNSNIPSNRIPLPYLYIRPHRWGENPERIRPTKQPRGASAT